MSTIQKDIIYGQGSGRSLKLDIYRPHHREHHHTAVLLLHGGGWRVGNKSMMDPFGPELARLGFLAVAPEYRLLGEAPWPAQLEDVKAAIRWTRTNAQSLEIDPDRVAVIGFSAGAHLALMAGGTPGITLMASGTPGITLMAGGTPGISLTAGGTPDLPGFKGRGGSDAESDRVAAVIAFFPPIEFTTGDAGPGATPAAYLLGETTSEEEAKRASPLFYVSRDYPPVFLLHGTADRMVPFASSRRMFDALNDHGVAVELHLYPHHTHEFARLPSMAVPVMSGIALFLKRTVVNPEKYVKENQELNMFARKET